MIQKIVPQKSGQAVDGLRRYRHPTNCAVCDNECRYHFCCVPCCLGCKYFFRRAIIQKKEFKCSNEGKCDVTKGEKCQSCRLDKCMLAGMNVKTIGTENPKEALEFAERRKQKAIERQKLFGQCEMLKSNSQLKYDPLELEGIMEILKFSEMKLHHFFVTMSWRAFNRSKICHSFDSLEKFYRSGENILRNVEQYTIECKDKSDVWDLFASCMVSMIELFRTMPVFSLLHPSDQALHMGYLSMPLIGICMRHYSVLYNSGVVVFPGGNGSMVNYYCSNPHYPCDSIIRQMAEQIFLKSVQPFIHAQLTSEEFLLLRSIILTHSGSAGLSLEAQAILQRHCERYARLLMCFLQLRYGGNGAAAARRYAELLLLVENIFYAEKKHRELIVYYSMLARDALHSTMPRAFYRMAAMGTTQ